MIVSRSREYHVSINRVARWCAWYTRGLAPEVRDERRDEIASDLYEHGIYADQIGMKPKEVSRQIVSRTARGFLADLAWRRRQLRDTTDVAASGFGSAGSLPTLAYSLGLVLFVWGGFVLTRVVISMGRGEWGWNADLAVTVLLSFLAAGCALLMFLRARTRSLGALWMMIAIYGLIRYGSKALVYSSASFSNLFYTTPNWDLLNLGMVAGLALFYLAMFLWWLPEQSAPNQQAALATHA